jgi:hypothetical protein
MKCVICGSSGRTLLLKSGTVEAVAGLIFVLDAWLCVPCIKHANAKVARAVGVGQEIARRRRAETEDTIESGTFRVVEAPDADEKKGA